MVSLGRCCHYYLHHELSPCQALASVALPISCSSAGDHPFHMPEQQFAGGSKQHCWASTQCLPKWEWEFTPLEHTSFIPWPFIKFWKEKVKILKSSYRRITSPPHASVSPLCVGWEYFTPEHCMDRTVTKCTALSSLQVASTSLHILLCLLSALIEIQDEVKGSTHCTQTFTPFLAKSFTA